MFHRSLFDKPLEITTVQKCSISVRRHRDTHTLAPPAICADTVPTLRTSVAAPARPHHTPALRTDAFLPPVLHLPRYASPRCIQPPALHLSPLPHPLHSPRYTSRATRVLHSPSPPALLRRTSCVLPLALTPPALHLTRSASRVTPRTALHIPRSAPSRVTPHDTHPGPTSRVLHPHYTSRANPPALHLPRSATLCLPRSGSRATPPLSVHGANSPALHLPRYLMRSSHPYLRARLPCSASRFLYPEPT